MRTVITNVRVFDGERVLDQSTVVINNDHIGIDPAGARIIDGNGGTVLPGLIDAHVHVGTREHLDRALRWGVTTMLNMGGFDIEGFAALRELDGVPALRTSHAAALRQGDFAKLMGFPAEVLLSDLDQVDDWVEEHVRTGADYIKLIVDQPGRQGALDAEDIQTVVAAAHKRNLLTIAHASSVAATRLAIDNGVDFSTHAPLDGVIDEQTVRATRGTIPTLTMMRQMAQVRYADSVEEHYGYARDSVTALHRAGVPILLGTDAHPPMMGPVVVNHGEAVHDELALLVEAGLTPIEALTAATSAIADRFGLTDRGRIAEMNRADLVLVDGDPTENIAATRNIRRVWCGGVEHGSTD